MQKIAIIDYGGSNLRSVFKALDKVAGRSAKVIVSSDTKEITRADKIVFPGQGAIGECMDQLQRAGLDHVIKEFCKLRPFLGICLGLQSLMADSEEDNGTKCLGIIDGFVQRFPKEVDSDPEKLTEKIPHMGWNNVSWKKDHPLIQGINSETRFYFVHSYFVRPSDQSLTVGETNYVTRFSSSIGFENVFATQFHPEKSSSAGLKMLGNFVQWNGNEY